MSNFAPIRIEFKLEAPIALTYPWIHFEGIIAHLLYRMKYPNYRALPSKRVQKLQEELPLKKFYYKGQFIYHASVSLFDADTPKEALKTLERLQTTRIYKRFYERKLNYGRVHVKKISRGSGYFRDFAISLPYLPVQRVVFYANGDPEIIEMLLENLPGLGKKTAIGYGMIKTYTVKEISEDCSITMGGYAMRPIPYFMLKDYESLVVMAYRAPFWAKENTAPCAPPFTKIKLRDENG